MQSIDAACCYRRNGVVELCWSRPSARQKRQKNDRDAVHVGLENDVIDGEHVGATWRIRWIDLCGSDNATCSKLFVVGDGIDTL